MKPSIFTFLLLSIFSFQSKAQWSEFCTGTTTGYIMDFTYHLGELYACGSITEIGGTSVNKMARWDGSQWQPVGDLTNDVHKLESLSTGLYACKYNPVATDSNWLYKWDGTQWQKFGDGFYLTNANAGIYHLASLYDVITFSGNIVVSGEFDVAGSDPVNGIASWNGAKWTSLGTGLEDANNASLGSNIYPHKMMIYHNDLYVVGNFKKAGGVVVKGVARYDGTSWHAVGDGFDKEVYGIEEFNDTLYVCGEFTASGANSLGCIAKWNGTEWVSPGIKLSSTLPGYHAFGHTLKVISDKLYLAGGFNKCIDAGNNTIVCSNVLEFNGSSWNGMDGGTDADVEGLADYNGLVLVGGSYDHAGGSLPVNSMALWATTTGISNTVKPALRVYPNPARDQLNVEGVHAGMSMQIYDIFGRCMKKLTADGNTSVIVTNDLTPGVYTLKLTDGSSAVSTAFIR